MIPQIVFLAGHFLKVTLWLDQLTTKYNLIHEMDCFNENKFSETVQILNYDPEYKQREI